MTRHSASLLIFLATVSVVANAQDPAFNTWSTVELKCHLNKWDFSAETELRSTNILEHTNRLSLELAATYSLNKHLKAGASYMPISFYDLKYDDYQLRHRASLFVTGRQKFGDFTFTLREKLQMTIKDESDRIDEDGVTDTYKINPELTWRNRIKVEYDVPKLPLTPALSFETFRQMNNPDGNVFCGLRYSVALGYKLNKRSKLELSGLYDHEINISDPENTFVLGFGYTFDF